MAPQYLFKKQIFFLVIDNINQNEIAIAGEWRKKKKTLEETKMFALKKINSTLTI